MARHLGASPSPATFRCRGRRCSALAPSLEAVQTSQMYRAHEAYKKTLLRFIDYSCYWMVLNDGH